jgi:hypothetical protein
VYDIREEKGVKEKRGQGMNCMEYLEVYIWWQKLKKCLTMAIKKSSWIKIPEN